MLEHSPAEHVRRPNVPAESPTLGFTHLQFEALLTAARESANDYDFALVAMLGLLGLRIFEATGASIADLTRPLPSDLIMAAAQADPEIARVAGPYQAMLALPGSLDAVQARARDIYAAGWCPPMPPGPTRDELAALVTAAASAGSCRAPRRDRPSRCSRGWSPVVLAGQVAAADGGSGGVGVVLARLQRFVDLPGERVCGELVQVTAGSAGEELGPADAEFGGLPGGLLVGVVRERDRCLHTISITGYYHGRDR